LKLHIITTKDLIIKKQMGRFALDADPPYDIEKKVSSEHLRCNKQLKRLV